MTAIDTKRKFLSDRARRAIAAATLFCFVAGEAAASVTDISNVPLASSTTATVKPNVMYLMDTSGSMAWGHMPDDENGNVGTIGYKNSSCNSLFYNPTTTYTLPKNYDASDRTAPSFTSASPDGYLGGTAVNLSTSFRAYTTTTGNSGSSDTSQAAYYYSYSGASMLTWNGPPCTATATSGSGSAGTITAQSSSDPASPATPSFTVTAVASVTGSVYTAANAGSYAYQVSAFNNIGESAATALGSVISIGAGGGARFVITDNGGTAPATGYRIYRTAVGASGTGTTAFVMAVARSSTNGVANATTTYTSTDDPGTWTKVTVSSTSGTGSSDERQNFANWYTYYRTRILMMKSAATRAFVQLTSGYRVGFVIISPSSPVSTSGTAPDFVPMADFTSSAKQTWFSAVTNQTVGSSTPLREALSRVGRYYANKTTGINSGMSDDPIQYSCQQNFTVLTTDGYWNGNGGVDMTGAAMDSNTYDSDISADPRPLWDGGTSQSQVTVDKSNIYRYRSCTAVTQRTQQKQKRTVQTQKTVTQTVQSTSQTIQTITQIGEQTSQDTRSTVSIIIDNNASSSSQSSSISAITIGGSNRLVSTVSNNSTNVQTRANNLASGIASAGLSGGYEVMANGACSGTLNNPIRGCPASLSGHGYAYVTLMAPAGTNTNTPSFTTNRVNSMTNVNAAGGTAFAGGTSTAPTLGTNTAFAPGTCTVGSTVGSPSYGAISGTTAGATRTVTNCVNGPNAQAATPVQSTTCTVASTTTNGTGTPPWATTTCTKPASPAANNTTNVGVQSCTPSGETSGNNWVTTTCNSSPAGTGTSFVDTATCSAQTAGSGNSWVGITCTNSNDTGFVNAGSCTASFSSPTTTQCQTTDTGFVEADTCTANSGPDANGLTITCGTGSAGNKIQYKTTTTTTTQGYSNGTLVGSPSTTSSTASSYSDVTGFCYATRTLPSLPTAGRPDSSTPPLVTSPCTAWPCVTISNTPTNQTTGTLADVAAYYYQTDLRPSMTDNVPPNGSGTEDDKATWQHMTTFTMGLGVSGTLSYQDDYKTAVSGDFQQIRDGSKLWPAPVHDDPTALDDLWHAAVNGRGQFFSAAEPNSVVSGLLTALAGINARVSAAAAAATSNLEPVAGDNFAYTAKYVTQKWVGDVEAHAIDLTTGQVLSGPGTTLPAITNASNATPIEITTTSAHGLASGDHVLISGVTGTTNANGSSWVVTVTSSTTFTLNGSVGNGAYTGGGSATKLDVVWTAQAQLDTKTNNQCDNRTIWLFRSGATNNLTPLTWNTYKCLSDGTPDTVTGATTGLNSSEQANFSSTQVASLSQYPSMTTGTTGTVDQRTPAAGANMLNFIRGQRGFEGFTTNDATKLYRARDHVFGDIVNAQPVFVRAPFASYTDTGYSAFKSANLNRSPALYVAANDGMLHALNGDTGAEMWAFMPTMVLPNLYKLADNNYANNHTYFTDGTPTIGDIYDTVTDSANPAWKTVLVAGMNAGAQGYYALDVTDPANPKALWEFKYSTTCYDPTNATTKAATNGADCHIGLTFNNPVISKTADGTWVVFVTSGYNNDDGNGYLYILNAVTGKIINRIATGVGTAATPSGLNHINNWVDNTLADNTTLRVYGVDLLGNIWRFDVNGSIGVANSVDAWLIGTATDGSSAQPITTRPELAEVSGTPFVFVGTGRLLGSSDTSNHQVQSIYGIKDPLTEPTTGTPAVPAPNYTPQMRSSLKQLTITTTGSGFTAVRTNGCTPSTGNCSSTNGWFMDLPEAGERVNVDMKLQLGTIVVASNVPESDACSIGGHSWINFFNYANGTAVANSAGQAVGQYLSSSLAVGLNIVRLPSGKTVVITTTSDAQQTTVSAPFDVPGPAGKRISWREIAQ